ncbi:hypothetical protein [Pendulispora albinea]|uniref:Uncharacterized protein n=1 Tax=Pendulispora albinea TaxID=2741071 RepID=A0ABZ2M5M2_9BACT
MSKPVPPPLPPRARKVAEVTPFVPVHAPIPTADGTMSTRQKLLLADAALALRDEQIAARVVHYKAELATSPELDRITEQVVAEFSELQRMSRVALPGPVAPPGPLTDRDKALLEIELIQSLKTMLSRVFRRDKLASVIERKLRELSKRFARLYFESELHEKMRGAGSATEAKTIRQPEQALYYALTRNHDTVVKQLESFEYAQPELLERAKDMLDEWVKGLRHEFLGRTTPELNALVSLLSEGLTKFFTQELPPLTGELAWEVVKEARLRDAPAAGDSRIRPGYKIAVDMFPAFRQAFERRFLQRLVPFAEDEMLAKVRASQGKFRTETIRFVADPRIFSDVCELVCDAVYDYLYNDGFLDLPADWRARLRGT